MALPPHEPGIRVAIGVSGAGKTHGVKLDVYRAARHMPVIVLDRMREWNEAPADIAVIGAHELRDAIPRIEGPSLVVVRPRDIITASEEASAWARDYPGVAGVAIPEAHRVLPSAGRLSGALEDCACAFRHHNVAMWLDTQRIALLNRTMMEQSRSLRLYAIAGDRDRAVVRELGDRELETAVREAAKRLEAGIAAGDPTSGAGWYVDVGLSRCGPYELRRD